MPCFAKEKLRLLIINVKPKTIRSFGCVLGALAYIFALKYRRIVQANLQYAFPEWNEGRVKQCALKVFQNYAMTVMEAVQMVCCRTASEISAMVDFSNVTADKIEKELSRHSIINISAHIGNWEAALQSGTANWHLPTSVIIQKIHNRKINAFFEWFRARFGVEIIYKRDAVKAMQRVLRSQRFLIMLVDQSKRKNAVPITFFGKLAYATPSVAMLALRYKVPVYVVYCVRNAKGRLQFFYTDPVKMPRTGDLKADVAAYTQKMQDALEEVVRAYPEQWFWFHKRWRYANPGLYRKGPVFGKNAPKRFNK